MTMGKTVIPEYAAYFEHLQKYRDELKTALENEREKRQALLGSDMDRLEAVLSSQQAQTMKLRSLEAKREQLQEGLCSGVTTASEFVSTLRDEDTKAAFSGLIAEMTELAAAIKEQNALALEIAKTNLKLLQKIFPTNNFDQSKAIYGPEGERRGDIGGHSVEIKF